LTGIEPDSSTARCASSNARLAGQGNVEFVHGKPEDLLPGSEAPDVLILSPKRGAVWPSVLRWALEARPPVVLLHADDLRAVQDVRSLVDGGYRLEAAEGFDDMPHVPRTEVLFTLS
jgi:tRNA/tmRNA/rRNA uracil-C5-methylase (TrmA/RlmC/RlmD family)